MIDLTSNLGNPYKTDRKREIVDLYRIDVDDPKNFSDRRQSKLRYKPTRSPTTKALFSNRLHDYNTGSNTKVEPAPKIQTIYRDQNGDRVKKLEQTVVDQQSEIDELYRIIG